MVPAFATTVTVVQRVISSPAPTTALDLVSVPSRVNVSVMLATWDLTAALPFVRLVRQVLMGN